MSGFNGGALGSRRGWLNMRCVANAIARNALSSPACGTLVYQEDTDEAYVYNGDTWIQLVNIGDSVDAASIKGVIVDDVDLADGRVLQYNVGTGNLEYETVDAVSINGITVDNTDIADGRLLQYNAVSGNLEYEDAASGVFDPEVEEIEIGFGAYGSGGSGDNRVVIGKNANVNSARGVAIGELAKGDGTNDCIAIGYNNNVSAGNYGILIGRNLSSANSNCVGIGQGHTANLGNRAICIGTQCTGTGIGSIAIGYIANAGSSNYGFALGANATASNSDAYCVSRSGTASGSRSYCAGYNTTASGSQSGAYGDSAQATAIGAGAFGYLANAGYNYSTALGYNSATTATYEVAIGVANASSQITIPAKKGTLGGLRFESNCVSLADDAQVALSHISTAAGWGFAQIGDNQEYAHFCFSTTGITLLSNSANVATSDSDTNFCIYDSGTSILIKNRLGSELTVRYVVYGC